MSTASVQLPEGRYGRSSDERADRKLRTAAIVLGAVLAVVVGWLGYHYVAGSKISAQVVAFSVTDDAVKVHLEVHKDSGAKGYCTLRSQNADGAEVGRADFRFSGGATQIDKVVTLRTTSRGSTAELLGCHNG
ncbi:DUF4307 domain-containing protein [Streptomyces sp. YIM S03343]